MAPVEISKIVSAIESILDPSCSVQVRSDSYQVCEEFRNSADCIDFAFSVLSLRDQYSINVCIFAINTLEDYIKKNAFETIGQASIDHLGKQLWAAFQSTTVADPKFLVEKEAILLVQYGIRTWPQMNPNFFTIMVELLVKSQNAFEQERALTLIRSFIAEIHGNQESSSLHWDAKRKDELEKALNFVLDDFTTKFVSIFDCVLGSWNKEGQNIGSLVLCTEIYGLLVACIEIESRTFSLILEGLLRLLLGKDCSELHTTVLLALDSLSERAKSTSDHVVDHFLSSCIPICNQIFAAYLQTGSYFQLFIFGNFFINFGLNKILKIRCRPNEAGLEGYINSTISLFGVDSLIIKSSCVNFWTALCKHESVSLFGQTISVKILSILLSWLAYLPPQKLDDQSIDAESFDDTRKYLEYHTALNNRTSDCIKELAIAWPLTIAEYLLTLVEGYANSCKAIFSANHHLRDADKFQWIALVQVIECSCRGFERLQDEKNQVEAVVEKIQCALLTLIQTSPSAIDPTLLSKFLQVIRATCMICPVECASISIIVRTLFELMFEYEYSICNDAKKRYEVESLIRGRSSSLLVKLATLYPTVFLPYLESLLQQVSQHQDNCDSKAIYVQRLVIELLLVLSIQPSLDSTLQAKIINECLVSIGTRCSWLTTCFGILTQIETQSKTNAEFTTFKRNTGNMLHLLHLTLKYITTNLTEHRYSQALLDQTIYPFCTLIQNFLYQFLSGMLGLMVAISTTSLKGELMADMELHEKKDWNLAMVSNEEELFLKGSTFELESVSGWSITCVISCYMSFGLLTNSKTFYQAPDMLYLKILSIQDARILSLNYLGILFKHLFPLLVRNIPEEHVGELRMQKCIVDLIAYAQVTLEKANATIQASEAKSDPTQPDNKRIDLLREQSIACTSNVVHFLFEILLPPDEREKPDVVLDFTAKNGSISFPTSHKITAVLMANLEFQESIVNLFCFVLSSLDSTVWITKAIAMLMRWLPTLMLNMRIQNLLLTRLVGAILMIIGKDRLVAYQTQCINLFTELYKWEIYLELNMIENQLSTGCKNTSSLRTEIRQASSLKKQRSIMKAFLGPLIIEASREARGAKYRVNKLEEKLEMIKKTVPTPIECEQSLNLDLLF